MNAQSTKLLLVEDNPGDARLVQEMLVEAGRGGSGARFRLTLVNQLNQALAIIAEESFDLILLDLSLPDSQGLATLYQILKAAPEVPVMILSGLGDEAVAIEAVKAGAQNYLVKGYMNEFSLPRDILYAIERKRVERNLYNRNRELALLNKIIAASAATTPLEPEELMETACTELAKTFNVAQATAILLNEDKTAAVVVAQYLQEGQRLAHGTTVAVAKRWIRHLLNHKRPLMANDAQTDPHLAPLHDLLRHCGIVSVLILPLCIHDEIVGALSLEATELRRFSIEELNLAWSVADQVAGALARARLNRERQLLSTAVEQTAESIVITDNEGVIVYVNPAFEQVTGYARAEVIGRNPRLLKSGRHEAPFYQEMWSRINTGQVWHGQFINRKKNGALFTEDVTITPVQDANGQILNYVAIKRDITQELQREEQYQQAQKMEAIGRLAGGITHDFNNLLTVITGYAELLLFRHAGTDERLHRELEQIKKASDRAAALSQQLLAFSRKQDLQPRILDLNEIIADIGKMLQRLIGEDIDLVIAPAENLGRVQADPGQIEQIIMNLAVNARDAMPGGGILTIETANVYLDESYANRHIEAKPGWYVMLAVTDTGAGMNADTRAKIFEPFFTTKSQGQGTGLGLATVYGIVKQSNGNIWVYSEPGQGTTFKIYLPQLTHSVENDEEEIIPPEPGFGSETVLVVEDEEMVRALVVDILGQKGYTVLTASDGQEAIQLCRQYQEPIHLLLTDVVMPGGMSGGQLTRLLWSLRPGLKVLYMSGYPDNGIAHRGILEKGTAFLQKPFSQNGLTLKVREVLDDWADLA